MLFLMPNQQCQSTEGFQYYVVKNLTLVHRILQGSMRTYSSAAYYSCLAYIHITKYKSCLINIFHPNGKQVAHVTSMMQCILEKWSIMTTA